MLVTQSCLTAWALWTIAHWASLSMGFPRQEYWSGQPFPSPGDLPIPDIEPGSPALQADSLPSEPGEAPWVTREARLLLAPREAPSLPYFLFTLQGFPDGTVIRNPPAKQETQRRRFDPWLGKFPGSGKWLPLQYSCLGNSTDREAPSGQQSMWLHTTEHNTSFIWILFQ